MISTTDYWTLRGLQHDRGPRAVIERIAEWTRSDTGLEKELEIRRGRVEELRRRWGPEPGWVTRVRSTVRTREALRELDTPPVVEFQPLVRPRVELQLTGHAWDEMRATLRAWAPDGVETGGVLFSNQQQRADPVCVVKASGPAPNSKHCPRSVVIGSADEIKRQLPDFLDHLVPVGDWHSHPGRGPATPSSTDRESWAQHLRIKGGPLYVSVIASRGSEGMGWSEPLFRAWVTYPSGKDNHFVCEPAKLEEGSTF